MKYEPEPKWLYRLYSNDNQICIKAMVAPYHGYTATYGGIGLGCNGLKVARLGNFNSIAGAPGEYETFCEGDILAKQTILFSRRYAKARKHFIKNLHDFIWRQTRSYYIQEVGICNKELADNFECVSIVGHGFYTELTFCLSGYSNYVHRHVGFLSEKEFNIFIKLWGENYEAGTK